MLAIHAPQLHGARRAAVQGVTRRAAACVYPQAIGGIGACHGQPQVTRQAGALLQRCSAAATLSWPLPTLHEYPPSTSYSSTAYAPLAPAPLAYELVQGNLVRLSVDARPKEVPTAVLLHGILGSRRNLQSFAQMIVEGFPSWQVLLVDLRCHGESAVAAGNAAVAAAAPHTVQSTALDVLALLRQLKLFPSMLVGHSFGGKVVMSMAEQFGPVLPRPVQVWVLDTLPGEVRAGGGAGVAPDARVDHPADLIAALQRMPLPIPNRAAVQQHLSEAGFSGAVARWMTTNLRAMAPAAAAVVDAWAPPAAYAPGRQQQRQQYHYGAPASSGGGLSWGFDLDGVAQLYSSYEATSLWPLLRRPPQGLRVDFVRAQGSAFRWGGADEAAIWDAGHRVHLLRDSGHWVHSDNPGGLFDILAPSFGEADLHLRRASEGARR